MTEHKVWMLGIGLLAAACAPTSATDAACCTVCDDHDHDHDHDHTVGQDDTEEPEEEAPPAEAPQRCDAGSDGWCDTWWQATARGTVRLNHGDDGWVKVRVLRSGSRRTCLDGDLPFWAGAGVQDGFLDPAIVDEGLVLEPGEGLDLAPQADWWCVDEEEPTHPGSELDSWGERVPDRLAALVAEDADSNADGVPDREQLAEDGTTVAQHAVWDAVETQALLTLGKTAWRDDGRVGVTLTTRNLGRVEGDWTIDDQVPPGWSVSEVRPEPAELVGSVETGWRMAWEGRTGSRGAEVLSYTLSRVSGVDRVYVELPAAHLEGPDQATSSTPAALYHLDVDRDGEVACR